MLEVATSAPLATDAGEGAEQDVANNGGKTTSEGSKSLGYSSKNAINLRVGTSDCRADAVCAGMTIN